MEDILRWFIMSSRVKVAFLLFWGIFLNIIPRSFATTNCIQTFTFFGITLDEIEQRKITFWIGEDVSGQCGWSHLIQVTVSDTSAHTVITSNVKYGEWDWLNECWKIFERPKHTMLSFEDEKGILSGLGIKIKISVPDPDSEMTEHLKEASRYGIEKIWTKRYGIERIILPEFKGIKTQLVYYYPTGFYCNYQISEVYFEPIFKHLIVFTHQPKLATGFDTMHGFLIFKILK